MKNSPRSSGTSASDNSFFEALEDRVLYAGDPLTLLPDSGAGGRSGSAVATCGNLIASGAYLSEVNGVTRAGAVRIYDALTGTLLRTITKPLAVSGDYFGSALAFTADGFLIVGAKGADGGVGAAYLVDMSDGSIAATIKNPTPALGDVFGASVAAVGTNILIGAMGDDTAASNAGAAYLFDRSGNVLTSYFSPKSGTNQYFGNTVASLLDSPVVGEYYGSRLGIRSGSVYVFDATLTGTIRTPTQIFDNPTPACDDHFGVSITTFGTQLFVGADGDDTAATNAGAAYVIDTITGNVTQTLLNPTPAYNDYFGRSLAANATMVVVGSPADDFGAMDSGQVHVFDSATGLLLRTLNNPAPSAGENFGAAVALFGDVVIVGSPGNDLSGTDAGAVYVFL